MAKQLTEAQMRKKFLVVLTANEGEATAAEMVEGTGFDKATVNTLAKALVKEGLIVPAAGGKIALPEEPEEETPAPKAKGKVAPPAAKGKKAVAPPEPEEDEDDDSNELEEDEDAEFDFDEDEGLDEGEDTEDEVEDEPAPKKAKKGGVSLEAPHKVFTMAFKPIDTLDDDELVERIDLSTAAAESLNEQGHELIAEMLMRSVAKARRQLNKRQA